MKRLEPFVLTALLALAAACGDASVAKLQISNLPSSTIAGDSQQFVVAALDDGGARVPGYTGTIHFTSSNPALQLPADYTFSGADLGAHAFGMVIETPGAVSITAADVAVPGFTATASTTTSAPPVTGIAVSLPASAATGQPFDVQVTVSDLWGGPATLYAGTVHFSSSDPQAVLPADYTFTAADLGVHTFSGGVTFQTDGAQTLTVTDATDSLSAQSPGTQVQ